MWLISWWVAWLMNFYGFSYKLQGMNIELHRYSMELHNIPYNSINTPRNSMEFHGTPRTIHGTAWHSMELYRYSKELHGIPWNSMNTPWILHGTPWILHGFLWNSMDFIEFHGGISRGNASHKYCGPELFKPYQLSYTSNLIEMYKHLITASTENCTVVQTYKFFFTFFVIDFFFLTSSSTALLTWLTSLDDTFNMSWIDKTHKAWKVFNNKQ